MSFSVKRRWKKPVKEWAVWVRGELDKSKAEWDNLTNKTICATRRLRRPRNRSSGWCHVASCLCPFLGHCCLLPYFLFASGLQEIQLPVDTWVTGKCTVWETAPEETVLSPRGEHKLLHKLLCNKAASQSAALVWGECRNTRANSACCAFNWPQVTTALFSSVCCCCFFNLFLTCCVSKPFQSFPQSLAW